MRSDNLFRTPPVWRRVSMAMLCMALGCTAMSQAYVEDVYYTEVSEGENDSLRSVYLNVQLSDTLNVQSIIITIGTVVNEDDVLECEYLVWNPAGSECVLDGTITNYRLSLLIENLTVDYGYYYKVSLRDYSENVYYVFNKII